MHSTPLVFKPRVYQFLDDAYQEFYCNRQIKVISSKDNCRDMWQNSDKMEIDVLKSRISDF